MVERRDRKVRRELKNPKSRDKGVAEVYRHLGVKMLIPRTTLPSIPAPICKDQQDFKKELEL